MSIKISAPNLILNRQKLNFVLFYKHEERGEFRGGTICSAKNRMGVQTTPIGKNDFLFGGKGDCFKTAIDHDYY